MPERSDQPIIVRQYTAGIRAWSRKPSIPTSKDATALPRVDEYTFANLLSSANAPELQTALDGIAEICAKSNMSLADEYGSHLPPVGELTSASALSALPQRHRVGAGVLQHHALTSVPEASSSGDSDCESSKRSSDGIYKHRLREAKDNRPAKGIKINGTRRRFSISTKALTMTSLSNTAVNAAQGAVHLPPVNSAQPVQQQQTVPQRAASAATSSLQTILGRARTTDTR